MFRMNDITSTEKLLDFIRKKSGQPDLTAPLPEKPLPATKNTPLAFFKKPVRPRAINVGIDIGHESLRLVKMERRADRQWRLIDYRDVRIPGEIQRNSPEFVAFLKAEIDRFCGLYRRIAVWAVMSAANVVVRHILIPRVPKNQIDKTVFWTIKRESPFNEAETILDFEVIGERLDQGRPQWIVTAYTAPRSEVAAIKTLFSQIDLPLTGISVVPFAVQNIFRTDWIPRRTETVAYLFIGNDFSRIDIYSKGNLIITRGIKAGINSMVEALQEALDSQAGRHPSVGQEENDSALTVAQARKILFSLSEDSAPLTVHDAGYSLRTEEKFQVILPALERLVRQVERTFDFYKTSVGPGEVRKIYVTSAMPVYVPLIRYVGEQIGCESEVLDPFNTEQFELDHAVRSFNLSERNALIPALGMALSDNAHTPNLLYTIAEKKQVATINQVSRIVFFILLALTLGLAGLSLFHVGTIAKKTLEADRHQEQLARYQPFVSQDDLLRVAVASKKLDSASRVYGERYRSLAVLGELAELTPAEVRLLKMKTTFGAATVEKGGDPAKSATAAVKDTPPPEQKDAAKPSAAQPGASPGSAVDLVVEGMIAGPRQSLESSLVAYLTKLQASPLLKQITVQSSSIEQLKRRDFLRFTLTMKAELM